MNNNLRTKEALTIENSPQTDICSETEVNPKPSSSLTQQMPNLTIEKSFTFHLALFYSFLTQPTNYINPGIRTPFGRNER